METPIRLGPRFGFWLLAGLLAQTQPAHAQAEFPTRTLRIQRLNAKVHIDGRLDEPVWSQLTPSGQFVQTQPDEGQPISERTEVLLFYDAHNLYVAFKCYDSDPDRIIGRLDARDARTFSDSVGVFLDPFGDRRTGYWFDVNSRGVQFDALMSETGDEFDSTWDGIWQSATARHDWGWSAEFAIPFRIMRFSTERPWGVNLSRSIVRKNEEAYWQFVTRFDGLWRPSKAGYLEGVSGVESGRNIEVVPYFSTRLRRGAVNPLDNGNQYEGGADLRWGLLPNATLNVTVNPDFADTEADEENITISRFELFFPEKRAFFNEGANFYNTPMGLFFTRRVGARLPDSNPQRILLGAKLTGKVGPWSVGLLEARTQETTFLDPGTGLQGTAPAANFFVLRMQKDIWRNSTIGFITANRDQQAGDVGSTQRAHGLDLNIVSGPNFRLVSQVAYNQNESATLGGAHRFAGGLLLNYDSDRWELGAGYRYFGNQFDIADIGFEPETDRHLGEANVEWKPYLNRRGIRQIFFELNQDVGYDTHGLLEDAGSDADLTVQFQNFWSARVRYSYDRVRFFEFTPAFTRLPTERVYIEPRIRFFLNSNENRAVSFNYDLLFRKMVQFRENFYGRSQEHRLSLNVRMFGRTRVQFRGTYIREFLLDHTPFQVRRLFITRLNHQFTPKLHVRILGQVSNDRSSQNFNVNSVFVYQFTARSAAILGYNYQKRAPGVVGDLGNEFFAKFSYLFHF